MFYGQNAPNIVNRAPDTMQNNLPRSRAVYGPALRQPAMENPSRWTPYGTFQPEPYLFEGHDGLRGALMSVEQADLYDASPNPFPNNGVFDHPGAAIAAVDGLLRLQPTTSAHPGHALPSGNASPTMVFHAPPANALQTMPIFALGL